MITKLDIEPKWSTIVKMALGSPRPSAYAENLLKLAKVGDIVRQAQKDGVILVLHPNGNSEQIKNTNRNLCSLNGITLLGEIEEVEE